jgi:ACS family tartrate transporter-like MFS transporter
LEHRDLTIDSAQVARVRPLAPPPTGAAALERRAVRKATRRLLPFLFLLYIVAWLDRANIGFAALQMNRDLGLDAAVYGFGAGVFFIGYALFEIPSNLLLDRLGARVWIARIMITWGILSTAMMFVQGARSFYGLRFALGIAEAGFFPGMVFYLSRWFPQADRARALAWFMTAIPLASVVGGPVSGFLLGFSGWFGLRGWQWLFLLEGLPAIVLGVVVLNYLTETPQEAEWLPPDERAALCARLQHEQDICRTQHSLNVVQALTHPIVWRLGLIYFLSSAGVYGLTLWIPTIIKGFSGLSDFMVGIVSTIPYVAAAVATVMIGASSDRTGERCLHVAIPCFVAAAAFAASAWLTSPVLMLLALTVAAAGNIGRNGPFWAMPTLFLTGSAAAGGIALINTLGALGGFVGPYLVGLAKSSTGSFASGLLVLSGLLLLCGVLALRLRRVLILRTVAP